MRHLRKGRKLNRTASHRRALMRNLSSSLILHKRIQTTDAKAKELRTFVEPLITFAKQGTLHARRQVLRTLPGKHGQKVTAILFDEIAPQMADRPGGYTRIIKLGYRTNDRAPVSMVELVDMASAPTEEPEESTKSEKKSKD
jgi:large subunit ribosomal protein L17